MICYCRLVGGAGSVIDPGCRAGRREDGFALLSVLIALALLATVGVALTAFGTIEYQTALNHRSATRSLLLADAGATHALALIRGPLSGYQYSDILEGSDGFFSTADDGVLDGYSLNAFDALPDTGMLMSDGRYFVSIVNDDGDPSGDPGVDTNHRLVAISRGMTSDGGSAEVRAVLVAFSFPAIVANGDLAMPGVPSVLGACGSVHANGTITIDGSPTINGEVSASDTVLLSGTITREDGSVVTPESDMPEIEVPEYNALEYCDRADFVLKSGWLITVGPPRDSTFIGTGTVMGWRWDSGTNEYSLSGNQALGGVYCVQGNVKVTGNAGSNGNPLAISIFATGSVDIGGNPKIEPAPGSEDILILAEGDLDISGNASGSTPAYAGMLYAGSQCRINGNPSIAGFLLCHDAPNPPGSIELIDENKVNGNPDITYDCAGERQRTSIASWSESRAQ